MKKYIFIIFALLLSVLCVSAYADQSGACDKTGHAWGETSYVWSPDNRTITAIHFCLNDNSHMEEETVDVTAVITSPTEDTRGSAIYTSDTFNIEGFTVQRKSISIPRLRNMSLLHLPNSIKRIYEEAFDGTDSEAVIFPDSCSDIGKHAFSNCKNLLYVKVPANINIDLDAFEGCEDVVIDQIGSIETPEEPDQLDYPNIIMNDSFETGLDVSFSVERDTKAEDYYLNLYRDGTQLYWNFHFWDPLSYTFKGYDLRAGNYVLIVTATADGYEPKNTEKHFTVTGTKHGAPSVTVDKLEVGPNEQYTFTVTISGANKILARKHIQGAYTEEILDVDSDNTNITYSSLGSRKKTYEFCALIDGHWSEFSELITIKPK